MSCAVYCLSDRVCVLFAVGCLMCDVCCLAVVGRRALFVARCLSLLFVVVLCLYCVVSSVVFDVCFLFVCCLCSVICCLLFVVRCLLFVVRCWLFVAGRLVYYVVCCPLFVIRCLFFSLCVFVGGSLLAVGCTLIMVLCCFGGHVWWLFVVACWLVVVCRLLFVVCHVLLVACCLLFGVRCSLFVVCCFLPVVGC